MFELALALGKTVGELERSITYRELWAWNDFYLDRQDEQPSEGKAAQRRMYRREDGPPPKELDKMSKDEIAAMFGASVG